jgi:hypothetical protein
MLHCLAIAAALAVQSPSQTSPSTAVGGPQLVLESLAGEMQTRPARGLDTQDPRQLGGSIVRFEGFPSKPVPQALPDSGVIELAHGDRLYGRVQGGRAELLDIEVAGPLHVGVPVDELKSLVFPARLSDLIASPLAAAADGDRIYRRQPDGLDRIDGAVEEFSAEGVRFHSVLGSKWIAWSDVAALFIENVAKDNASRRESAPAGGLVPVVVDLIDHSRLRGGLKRLTGEECRLVAKGGFELAIPAAALAELYVDDGSIVFLSTLRPDAAVDSTPFGDDLGMRWPHRIDQSVTSTPLTAGGRVHMRGIGVHAPSKITWKLDGAYATLRGRVAIDDQVLRLSARGSVIFRILIDGAKAWESAVVRGGDPPVAVPPVKLAGAHELALEVDVADNSCVADRADWLDMLLVR